MDAPSPGNLSQLSAVVDANVYMHLVEKSNVNETPRMKNTNVPDNPARFEVKVSRSESFSEITYP